MRKNEPTLDHSGGVHGKACWLIAYIRRIWKLPYRTHNIVLHLINGSLSIDVTLEKRSVKYILNLINGENKLPGSIVKLSLYNNSTTLGEKIRYFMYKYKIYDYERY